jgi:hypothetical protein
MKESSDLAGYLALWLLGRSAAAMVSALVFIRWWCSSSRRASSQPLDSGLLGGCSRRIHPQQGTATQVQRVFFLARARPVALRSLSCRLPGCTLPVLLQPLRARLLLRGWGYWGWGGLVVRKSSYAAFHTRSQRRQ